MASGSGFGKLNSSFCEKTPVPHYAVIVFWSDEDGAWVADVPDLKSCLGLRR